MKAILVLIDSASEKHIKQTPIHQLRRNINSYLQILSPKETASNPRAKRLERIDLRVIKAVHRKNRYSMDSDFPVHI